MHEFSITQKLLDVALTKAKSRRIVNVNLLIGPFSEEREEFDPVLLERPGKRYIR